MVMLEQKNAVTQMTVTNGTLTEQNFFNQTIVTEQTIAKERDVAFSLELVFIWTRCRRGSIITHHACGTSCNE